MATGGGAERWALAPEWRLRPSYDRAAVYRFDPSEATWWLADWWDGLLLALLDGRRTLDQAFAAFRRAVPDGPDPADCWRRVESADFVRRRSVLTRLETPGQAHTRTDLLTFLRLSRPREPDTPLGYGRLERPLSLLLMPSDRCVRDCVYCYAERRPVPRRQRLSTGRWLELIDEAGAMGIDCAVFSGGDPFTHPGIFDLVERLSRWGMTFILPTKRALSRADADRLAAADPARGRFQVSLDGVDPAVVDRLLGVPGSCRQLLATIANLLAAGLDVQVNAVITPHNLAGVDDLVPRLHALGVGRCNVTNYGRSFYRHRDELFLSPGQVDRLVETVEGWRQTLGWERLSCNARVVDYSRPREGGRKRAWRERALCSAGRSSMTLAPDGKVVLCEQAPQRPPFVVADVSRTCLEEAWRSPAWFDLLAPPREAFRGTACFDCPTLDDCRLGRGYCLRDAHFVFGTPHHPPPNCPRAPAGWRMG